MTVHRYATCDSTNERALAALAAGGARHGDVHVAREQTAGRGSRGRRWHAPPGEALLASVVLMPPLRAASPTALTIAAALGVRDALRALGLDRARLKWPNDVLVGDAKVAGILIEARGLDPAAPALVCGIGVNVRQRAFPADLARPATSLALEGVDVALDVVLERVLRALDARIAQAAGDRDALARDFAGAAGISGPVRVRLGEREERGTCERFALEGLALRTAAGTRSFALEHVTALEPDPAG